MDKVTAQVMKTSGHGVECATAALEQAGGDVEGALLRLTCWGKSCGRRCLPGTDLLSRYGTKRAQA